MRRTIAALGTTTLIASAIAIAIAACKGDDRPATPAPAAAPAPLPPAPIHVAPSTPAPAPLDPESARRELDHLDSVIVHAKEELAAAHTEPERIKARTLLNATQKRRDALAQRLAQPVPQ